MWLGLGYSECSPEACQRGSGTKENLRRGGSFVKCLRNAPVLVYVDVWAKDSSSTIFETLSQFMLFRHTGSEEGSLYHFAAAGVRGQKPLSRGPFLALGVFELPLYKPAIEREQESQFPVFVLDVVEDFREFF
jgi:hypothetical protein